MSARLSAELTALASLVDLVGAAGGAAAPSDAASVPSAASASPSVEADGIRGWQRGILGRLTRARQRRDIRLKRKVLYHHHRQEFKEVEGSTQERGGNKSPNSCTPKI